MEQLGTATVSLTYGIALFIFVSSIFWSPLYSFLKLSFRKLYLTTVSFVFISATTNFMGFFLRNQFYLQLFDALFIISLILSFTLIREAFKKNYTLPIALGVMSLAMFTVFSAVGIYHKSLILGLTFSSLVYITAATSVFLVVHDIVLGVIRKDDRYINSDVYIGHTHLLVGLGVIVPLILLNVFSGSFPINYRFILNSLLSLAGISTLFHARLNYIFILKSKLLEENKKYMLLYKSMVDEMLVGREIVEKLLPSRKSINGLEFDKYFKPMVLVGGDFLDIIPLSESRFIAYVADVSGHGVSAGIIVSMVKTLVLKEVVKGYSNLSSIVRNLNSDFNNLIKETGRYATMFMTFIDKSRKKFSYVSCGHVDCLYWSSKLNEFFLLSSTAPLLGLLTKIDAYSSEIDFNENDYLLLISDGIFSIQGKDGKTLSMDEFINILSKYISSKIMPNELVFRVSQEVETFMEGKQVVDDITFLFIRL